MRGLLKPRIFIAINGMSPITRPITVHCHKTYCFKKYEFGISKPTAKLCNKNPLCKQGEKGYFSLSKSFGLGMRCFTISFKVFLKRPFRVGIFLSGTGYGSSGLFWPLLSKARRWLG